MNNLPQRVEQTIASHRLLADGDAALVAVSGGVDSMVLLHVLVELSTTHRWKLVVAHFNHQLRGRDADADERFVARTAKRLGLPFESGRADVKEFARARKISVEMAARTLRHEFLARTAGKLSLRNIALAHHADDQVELFFVRLLRGAGTQGLGGMEWSAPSPAVHDIALLRPLLGETKAALAEYAHAKKISFREDATNRATDILRNRLRHDLLPRLRRDYAPALDGAVRRSMELVHDEGEFVTLEAIAWLKKERRGAFDTLHVALQRRVIQLGLLGHGVAPEFGHVEELRTQPGEWLTVRAGFICRRTAGGDIEARPVRRVNFLSGEAHVTLGQRAGRASVGAAMLTWSFRPGGELPPPRPHTECFDADAVGESIVLRHWRAGDRFQPIGSRHTVKLQDFFVNQKIPRDRRRELWLATARAGEIFWVEGQRIGERFKVTPATRRMLQWNWRQS